jgi:uncharacterized protein
MAEAPLRRRAYLGLELEPGQDGPRVAGAAPNCTASLAGMRPGDRLIAIAGESVATADDVSRIVRGIAAGSPVSFTVERAGARVALGAVASAFPLEPLAAGRIVLDELPTASGRRRVIRSVPDAEPPFPVVYLLPGASWASSEFSLDPNAPLLRLVSGLTALGFATQRVERSGVGDSEGPPCREVGFHSELSDYRAGLEHLRRWSACDERGVFLLGISLGGMIAPLLADADVRGVAVFGTPAQPISRANRNAAERFWRRAGVSESEIEARLLRQAMLDELVYGKKLTPEDAFSQRPELRQELEGSYSGGFVFGRTARFFQELDEVDLGAAWRGLLCPALALHGEHDWVTSRDDALAIAALARAGCFAELAGVDHELRGAAGGDELGAFAPAVLDAVVMFFDELSAA